MSIFATPNRERPDECDAGRRAFFGGRWTTPCTYEGDRIHIIGSPGIKAAIHLCDRHFLEVSQAGHVEEPFIDEGEFERRRARDGFER